MVVAAGDRRRTGGILVWTLSIEDALGRCLKDVLARLRQQL
jgi:hypothetical protein